MHSELIVALREAGHDARGAFLLPGARPLEVSYPAWSTAEGGRLVVNVGKMRRLVRKILGEWQPDVFYGAAAEAAGAIGAVPEGVLRVATSHHYDPPDLSDALRLSEPLASLRRLRRLQRFYLERRLLRRAHLVLAVSRFGADALATRGYLPRGTVPRILRNGVADDWFLESHTASDRRGFLFVGRLDQQKGVDVLLDALARTAGSWPLTIVGSGWQDSRLRSATLELGLEGRVRFCGHEPPASVRRRMAGAGALVAPSRAENYPLVLLEALARGLPVIATAVGGIPEMVRHDTSAVLVEPEDPDALAGALDRVETDAALRRRLAYEGARVADAHRWSRIAEELLDHLTVAGVPLSATAAR